MRESEKGPEDLVGDFTNGARVSGASNVPTGERDSFLPTCSEMETRWKIFVNSALTGSGHRYYEKTLIRASTEISGF